LTRNDPSRNYHAAVHGEIFARRPVNTGLLVIGKTLDDEKVPSFACQYLKLVFEYVQFNGSKNSESYT
jgi:hypothetical protein